MEEVTIMDTTVAVDIMVEAGITVVADLEAMEDMGTCLQMMPF